MAEVFRIQKGDVRRTGGGPSAQGGRDVLYDYAEAEALWNESDTTAPGPVGELPRAAFQSPANDGHDDEFAAVLDQDQRARRRRVIRSRLLLGAAVVLVAGGSYLWGAANRSATAVVAPVIMPPSPLPARAPEGVVPLDRPATVVPVGGRAAPEDPAAVAARDAAAGHGATAVETGDGHRRHRGPDRHRWHRAAAAPPDGAPAATDWPEATEPGPRSRRVRLRPIDVADPFAR